MKAKATSKIVVNVEFFIVLDLSAKNKKASSFEPLDALCFIYNFFTLISTNTSMLALLKMSLVFPSSTGTSLEDLKIRNH